jgi:uncharacterized membrane protein (UPF0127 family)
MNRPSYQLLVATLAFALITALGACQEKPRRNNSPVTRSFQTEGTLDFLRSDSSVITTIDIEISDTPESRRQGLMYRRSLEMDQGMLFIFPEVSSSGFWMKNTYIPLDIIFVGPDSQVVSIARRTRIMSERTIEPKAPKQFVVEVPAGFSRTFGIDTSTGIRWTREETEDRSFFGRIWDQLRAAVGG